VADTSRMTERPEPPRRQSGACRWAAAAWPGGTRTTLEPRPTGGANQRKGPGPHEGLGSSRENQRLATAARSQLLQLGNQAGKAPAQGGNEQEPGQREAGPEQPHAWLASAG
jgi:hypothetical protein